MQEVYDRQKELILLGERVVLATLGFDLNVHYPYKPLTETIKKFKITHNVLPQAVWNFVDDGYANSTLALFINTSTQFMSVLHAKKVVHST
jgi:cyclin T